MKTKTENLSYVSSAGLFLVLLLLIFPVVTAVEVVNLEIVSHERGYDSDNPIISKTSPDFKLGKGKLTTTYETSSYQGCLAGPCFGWGRVDTKFIGSCYLNDVIRTPKSAVTNQPYKEVGIFDITESQGDTLFTAWLTAPSVCQAMQICQQGTQLAAKQKFTIEFLPGDGSENDINDNNGFDGPYPDMSGKWDGYGNNGYRGICEIRQSGNSLEFINENDQRSSGKFTDAETVIASDWENGLTGHLEDNGNRINWENNTWWVKK